MIKFYKMKKENGYPIYLVLLMVCITFFYRMSDMALWEVILAFASGLSMIFLVFWMNALTVIVSDEGISISLVLGRRIIKTQSFLAWDKIWKVDISPLGSIVLVPKGETKEYRYFKSSELFHIRTIYKDYFDILQDILDNSKDADIFDVVLKKLENHRKKYQV